MAYTFENFVPAEQVTAYKDSIAETADKPIELTFQNGENKISVLVRPFLDLNTFASAVESAVSSCFDEEGKYIPWMRDIALMHVVVSAYTNLELPGDLHELFDLLSYTNIFGKVLDVVDQFQFDMLKRAVERRVRNTLEELNSSREQELDRALAMLNFITQKYNEIGVVFNEMMGDETIQLMEKLKEHANDVTDEVQAIREKLGVDDEDSVNEGGEE